MKKEIFRILQSIGDNQPHSANEIFFLGTSLLKTNTGRFNNLFRRAVLYNLIHGVDDNFYRKAFGDRNFQLTKKGDEALRTITIDQGGDYRYYKTYDRSSEDVSRFNKGKVNMAQRRPDGYNLGHAKPYKV